MGARLANLRADHILRLPVGLSNYCGAIADTNLFVCIFEAELPLVACVCMCVHNDGSTAKGLGGGRWNSSMLSSVLMRLKLEGI